MASSTLTVTVRCRWWVHGLLKCVSFAPECISLRVLAWAVERGVYVTHPDGRPLRGK